MSLYLDASVSEGDLDGEPVSIDVCFESDVLQRVVVAVCEFDRCFVGFFDHRRDGLQRLERETGQLGAVASEGVCVEALVFLSDQRIPVGRAG